MCPGHILIYSGLYNYESKQKTDNKFVFSILVQKFKMLKGQLFD